MLTVLKNMKRIRFYPSWALTNTVLLSSNIKEIHKLQLVCTQSVHCASTCSRKSKKHKISILLFHIIRCSKFQREKSRNNIIALNRMLSINYMDNGALMDIIVLFLWVKSWTFSIVVSHNIWCFDYWTLRSFQAIQLNLQVGVKKIHILNATITSKFKCLRCDPMVGSV